MKVADFGRFDGAIALFGGPYSNLQATQALAATLGEMPAVCTGDVVAYCGDPAATVAFVRSKQWPVIAGNCELQIAEGAGDCGCGFGDGTTCDLLSKGWYPHALAACDAETRDWMGALPEFGVFVHDSKRYAVLHGGASSVNRFLWPSSAEDDFQAEIALVERAVGPVDGVVAGHSGIAFQRTIGRHRWINAGAIGLPPHDGRQETRFAVLEHGEVTFHRLAYDYEKAASTMDALGLTQGYNAALRSGIWPSEDILPTELRR